MEQESVTRDDEESMTETGQKHSLTKAQYGKSIKAVQVRLLGLFKVRTVHLKRESCVPYITDCFTSNT